VPEEATKWRSKELENLQPILLAKSINITLIHSSMACDVAIEQQ
jgi:hypothetical protein